MNNNCFYYHAGQKWYTKYDAIKSTIKSTDEDEPLCFFYYDDFFTAQNWLQEPESSLAELYKNRALEIRNQYEYVVLAYSGGIDSTNMLETFYYNNIHIDEILMVGAFSRDSSFGSDENHNAELYFNCFETLKKLHLPKTKITVLDSSINMDQLSLVLDSEWYKNIGVGYSFHHWFWYDIHTRYESIKNTGIIFAIDKPYVRVSELDDQYSFFCRFVDKGLCQYGFTMDRYNNTVTNNAERVNFYWYPNSTCFQIMCKQAYVIQRFFHTYVGEDKLISLAEFKKNQSEKIPAQVAYNIKHKLKFISPKTTSTLFSFRDKFFQKDDKLLELDIFKNYARGIIRMIDDDQLKRFIDPIFSRKYFIKSV